MTSAADGSVALAQAQPPVTPDVVTSRRRFTLRRGERQIVDLQPGEGIALDALPAALTYRRTSAGLLVVGPDGAEILLRVPTDQPITGDAELGDGSRASIADLIANALQDVAPAAGPEAGPVAPSAPPALAGSGQGNFASLLVNPLVGLVDTGPLGFSQLGRSTPEPVFRNLPLDGAPGAGGAATIVPPKDVVVSGGPAAAAETDAPVDVPLALGIAIADSDGGTPERLLRVEITFAVAPPAGASFSDGTLAGRVLVLDVADFGGDSAALLAAVAALRITLPADWGGVLPASVVATTDEGASDPFAFDVVVAPSPDIVATATGDSGTESDEPVELAIPLAAAIDDTNGDLPETLAGVTITFPGLPPGASASAGTLVGEVLTLTAAEFGGPAGLAAALAALRLTLPADWSGTIDASVVMRSTEGEAAPVIVTLSIAPAADVEVVVPDVTSVETDAPLVIAVPVAATITDLNGAVPETLASVVVTFAALPPGTRFSAGELVGTVLTLSAASLGGAAALQSALAALTIEVPADWSGTLTGTAVATSSEGVGAPDAFTITVAPEGDVAVTGSDAVGVETNAPVVLAIPVIATIGDLNGELPETLASVRITFTDLPPGSGFSHGILAGADLELDAAAFGGSAGLAAALASLTIIVPPDWSGVIPASVVARSTEGESIAATFTVSVTPSPDIVATASDVLAIESPTPLVLAIPITTAISDVSAGAPETLSRIVVTFTGLPPGATFSAGTLAGDTLTLDVAGFGGDPAALATALAALTVTLPPGFSGGIAAIVQPFSSEGAGLAASFAIDVLGASGTPGLTLPVSPSVLEDLGGGVGALAVTVTPGGPGETAWVVIEGIPADVTLSAPGGALSPVGGVVTVSAADALGLSITGLPADSDADIVLTLTPFSQDLGAPPAAGAPQTLVVTVDAVVDGLVVNTMPAVGAAGSPIPLVFFATLGDSDGSESVLRYLIDGVPPGSILLAGATTLTPDAGGTYALTPPEVAGLSLVLPAGTAGPVMLIVTGLVGETPTDRESDLTNNEAAGSAPLIITLLPDDELPTITTTPVTTVEDLAGEPPGGVVLPATLTPGTSATSSWVVVSGIPAGMTFNVGAPAGTGAIRIEAADLPALRLVALPADSDADVVLTLAPFSAGPLGTIAGAPQTWTITVDAAADVPVLTALPALGAEALPIPLTITASFGDTLDGSETHTIEIAGVPAGATLSAGTDLGGGT
ncbi:MAG: hypothetical protein JNK67_05525, partial [Alphaproteobacteria bacterium]|nr:hypothetical protein [Alphaproteobacteria bacterium]